MNLPKYQEMLAGGLPSLTTHLAVRVSYSRKVSRASVPGFVSISGGDGSPIVKIL